MSNAFIYIIECCDDNHYVKIGITTDNPLVRLKNLQTGCPYQLRLIASFNTLAPLARVEKTLHTQLEKFRLSNRQEWFNLSPEHATSFVTGSIFALSNLYSSEIGENEDIVELEKFQDKDSLTLIDAMDVLDCSDSTIRRLLKNGAFKNSFKNNNKVFIPKEDIKNYIAETLMNVGGQPC